MTGRLEGRVFAITGGASGIGAATGRLAAAEGASVVLADIQDDLGAVAVERLGEAASYVHCDVSREADVAGLIDGAVDRFGHLDCMFNNAGIVGALGPIDETPLEEYEFTVGILMRSVFLGMKHAARVMKPQGSGVILSTTSCVGLRGGLGPHVYAGCKAAIVGWTRNVAAELGPWGIRVNAIAPGKHATPMFADAALGDPAAVDDTEAFTRLSPIRGRHGTAEDIGEAAVWLASDQAGFVSGITMSVDGGLVSGSAEGAQPGAGAFAGHLPLIREGGRRGVG
jgi:NAD(P)-dependent dehydrogenase (short-subunit alcohol dehydrogenase family)